MNVVGYKVKESGRGNGKVQLFYMNVVGYKGILPITAFKLHGHVLYERSGI